ncbi:serine hydrolase [Rhodohalobacter sulfatireducens]|uniref:beta-lactamase n=1 Tax=Rhodohalobacter sulfatireducens TaxID=2911366 RepID=A0ABS9KHF2_9BACT|nr:serine hydrolase [Rhodohalobacter sulfatireducens]MCG2590278.1 class A beta-lactamase-related serine hydrolase [Rhodohalobacter sulfatireducens]
MHSFFLLILLFISGFHETDPDIVTLKSEIEEYLSEQEGTFSVWFQHLQEDEQHFAINEDTLFHAASTMKTPVMIEIFKRVEQGELSLDDSIKVENKFYSIVDGSEFRMTLSPDSNDPIEKMVGEMATIRDLNHAMITYSSNLATNILIKLVGAEETTQTMRELGAERIKVLRGVEDLKAFEKGLSNRTTARDLGIILEHLARGSAVNPEMDQQMIEVLKDQYYRDIVPAKLPDEVVIANKTGSITGVEHDSAIVYLPDGSSYVLIFLSKNVPENVEGREIGSKVSKMIYDYLTSG